MTSPRYKNEPHQYVFDDFVLRNDGELLHHNNKIHIPPKELSVFILLLEANGEIVSKEEIIGQVWSRGIASDESLTRCIYTLRKALRETKHRKYIETIYGKGYKFRSQVAIVSQQEKRRKGTSVAVFPFRLKDTLNGTQLHHELVQGLSQYACYGLEVFPVSITCEVDRLDKISSFVEHIKPEYYITGQVISDHNEWRVFVELVDASTYKLVEHRSFEFSPDSSISVLLTKIINLLVEKIPSIKISVNSLQQINSVDTAITYLCGRREMYYYTPDSLQLALNMFCECISANPQHVLPYCCLAECYISLALLGLYDQHNAIKNAMNAVDKAIQLNPACSQALGLLGLLSGLKGEKSAAIVLFKQAEMLTPNSSDIFYYHSLFYFLMKDTHNALKYAEKCIESDPNRLDAGILLLWIKYYSVTLDETIVIGEKLLEKHAGDNPVLTGMMALFMALKGNKDKSEVFLKKLKNIPNEGFAAVNYHYTRYLLYGYSVKNDIVNFIKSSEVLRKVRGSLLPLILITSGRKEMEFFWQQLKTEKNIWSNIWDQDPRLSGFKNLLAGNKPDVEAA